MPDITRNIRKFLEHPGSTGDSICLEEAVRHFALLPNSAATQTLARHGTQLASTRYQVRPDKGTGSCEFLTLGPDLFVIVTSVQYDRTISIPVLGEDFVEFHFRLSGGLQIVDEAEEVAVAKGSLLIWRQPAGCDVVEHLNGNGQRESSVTIYFRPDFLERHFGSARVPRDADLVEVLAPHCAGKRHLQAALYPSLSKLVIDLAAPGNRSGAGLVRAEALAIQIIAEVLDNAEFQKGAPAGDTCLRDRDIACLRRAREILIRQHAPAPTIDELGRRVGLSPTKLKSGFRKLFGHTIFEFANSLRMETAKDLLRKSDRPIGHVSAELGYEHQNSFTVAFRRRFGVLPRDYRRDPLAHDRL